MDPEERTLRTLSPKTVGDLGFSNKKDLEEGLDAWESLEPETVNGMVEFHTAGDHTGDDWRQAFLPLAGLNNRVLKFVLEQLLEESGIGGAVITTGARNAREG
jgi:hypothetical protein